MTEMITECPICGGANCTCEGVGLSAIALRKEIARLRAQLEAQSQQLREVSAWAYQLAGAADEPVEHLDNLAALAQGESPKHPWQATGIGLEAQSRDAARLALITGELRGAGDAMREWFYCTTPESMLWDEVCKKFEASMAGAKGEQ